MANHDRREVGDGGVNVAAAFIMDLKSLQACFGKTMRGERHAMPAGCIRPAGKLSPAQSMEVYCRNMQSTLARVLHDVYPVCAQLLGRTRFGGIVAGYTRLHPSENSDLNCYGVGFADFLQLYCDENVTAESPLGCLPELARLEWCHHFAYYAEDDPVFDLAAFSKVRESEYERIVFGVSRSLALISSDYPLYSIWHSHQAAGKRVRRDYLCVCRDRLRPVLRRLPPETYRLLDAIVEGGTLGALARRFEGLERCLPPLIGKAWVASFHFKADA